MLSSGLGKMSYIYTSICSTRATSSSTHNGSFDTTAFIFCPILIETTITTSADAATPRGYMLHPSGVGGGSWKSLPGKGTFTPLPCGKPPLPQ